MSTKINKLIRILFATALIVTGVVDIKRVHAQVIPTTEYKVPAPTVVTIPYNPGAYPSNQAINYIRTWMARQPYTTELELLNSAASPREVNIKTQFMDGFGRPIQSVDWQASPQKKDMVQINVYDEYGREQFQFLPYTSTTSAGVLKSDPFGEQSTFYRTGYPAEQPAIQDEKLFYSRTEYEASPMNRELGKYLPGNSWIGSEKKTGTQYLLNIPDDKVQKWYITSNPLTYSGNDITTNIPTTNTTYAPGQLSKTVTTDPHGSKTIAFTDKDGHEVLKKVQIGSVADNDPYTNWLCTYYLYDDIGKLRFVIPPKAVASMALTGNWVLNVDMINELCFRYEYDGRLRMIAQKVPGAGWTYMVYDQLDRLVYMQDANMRLHNLWLGTIYDNLDRKVQTGMLTYDGNRAQLQTYVNGNTGKIILSGQAVNGNYSPGTIIPDLHVAVREPGKTLYEAFYSITFDAGFESETGANFETSITAPGGGAPTSIAMGSDNTIPAGNNFVPLTYSYYDNYSFTSKTYNNSNNAKLDQGNNTYTDPLPSTATVFTKSLPTGSRVWVIENANDLSQGKWLESVSFYDDKGRTIQLQSNNYKDGLDTKTNRYDFMDNIICSYQVHNNPAGNVSNLRIKTNWEFDHGGRLILVKKTLDDDAAKSRLLVYNEYDALGKLKVRKLGQKTDILGNPVAINNPAADNSNWFEMDNYTYNIQGWLKGVNWNYGAGPTNSRINYQNNKWFGMDLSYDWGFGVDNAQLNGNISGQRWVSAGDNKERSYGYSYDRSRRLLKADFTQNFGGGLSPNWSAADPNSSFRIDFSVKVGDGQTSSLAYDANGNILKMQQSALYLNTSSTADDLLYKYAKNDMSNKLLYVKDETTAPAANLGDFTDMNTGTDDYGYDLNGNMITDKNKHLDGTADIDQTLGGAIKYNFLNLPWLITVKNGSTQKGTITYIYDATGAKLEKRINEDAAPYNNNTAKATTVTYLGGFVYTGNKLEYFSHEYGKIRPGSTSQPYVYDYFLSDHLGNTRMVLTDERVQNTYPVATMEDNAAALANEQAIYNIKTANIVYNSSIPGFTDANGNALPANVYYNNNGDPPYNNNNAANTNAQSARMYKLNGATGDKTGLGMALKVMTGDQVNIWARSYYHTNSGVVPDNSYTINATTTALANFLSAFAGTLPLLDKGVTGAALNASPVTPVDVDNWLDNRPSPAAGIPKAYVNWILFDEQFRPVASNCGFDPVHSQSDNLKFHQQTVAVSQSGFLYVYCSNESDVNVYFDNLQVVLNRGPELEETHYYPFGLTMAGISAKAADKAENLLKYNGKELQHKEFTDGSGLELYDFGARNFDPQIGRWQMVDPKAAQMLRWSPYNYAFDNPLSFIDPKGMSPTDWYKTSSGDYIWLNTTGPVSGYEHLGAYTTLRSAEYQSGKAPNVLQYYYLHDDGTATTNGVRYGNGETIVMRAGAKITTGVGSFETPYLTFEASGVISAGTGFSHSGLENVSISANGMSLDLVGVKVSNNLLKPINTGPTWDFTLAGKNMTTGIRSMTNGNFELSYRDNGIGWESTREWLPSGKVNDITKSSIALFGFTFERTSSSDGSWSNELKFGASWYRSLFIGVKGEVSLSLFKESYKPNK